jgi:DNA-binding NtrC family response regulator
LFGHEKGAFTDARSSRPGLIEIAAEGTLFLDEIGAMPLEIQAKLLLFLEDGEIRRLGGRKTIPIRTRVIAASNENLRSWVASRMFRADLFYRLDVASMELPTLRETPDIIPALAERMVIELCRRYDRPVPVMDRETFQPLLAHSWPGNARELRNVVERSVMFLEGRSIRWQLPPMEPSEKAFWMRPGMTIEEVEREYMIATFRAFPHADYVTLAARLGISRKTLWKKRLKYGLPTRDEC